MTINLGKARQGIVLAATLVAFASACLAGEQKLAIHDYTGRGFPPDLVEYSVKGPEKSWDRLRVFNEDGKQIPCQVRQGSEKGAGLLQFVAALPANGTLAYTVRDAGGDRAAGGVRTAKEVENLVLSNSLLAVRVPGETDKTFDPAVAAGSLPAPILAFRQASGNWLGKSGILSQKKVKALRVKLVASGSICASLSYELLWADGGYYRATVDVIDQVPLAKVREEYDMNTLDGTQFWELELSQGWKPDRAQTASHNGNGGGDPVGRIVDFPGLMGGQPVQYMVGDQAWGKLSHLGLFREADIKATPKAFPLVGVVPLRKGLWRRSNAVEVRSANANDMRVRFPMGARYAEWERDITSETSPFSTQEHEPALPQTYGRRVWGLALGHPSIPDPVGDKPVYQLQRIYGIIGLDRYKDYVLDWPDGNPSYPRLYGGKLTAAEANASGCLARMRQVCNNYFVSACASHHATAANYVIAAEADAVLGQPGLPPDTRREIRACLALLTYVYEDADMMSYGNGHHHGNPNMGTARFWSGPCFMALLPDHPMFSAWRDHMARYGEYNMSWQVAPGGGYLEFGEAYHMHGFARATNGVPGLKSAGATNVERLLKNYVAPDWRYYMNLLTPYDSRWSSRMIPGMANSQPGNTENFLEAAGTVANFDSELSANLAWAWQANGAPPGANAALARTAVKPVEPALASRIYPGVGVVFRAHQGPQETYMLLRGGFQWSHWTVDPGHIILMSKGAVLVPYQPFQYQDSNDPSFDLQNTIRFGHPENDWPHGWGDSTVLDHAFGASVDYAWASTGFPEWFIKPGIAPTWRNPANVTAAGERKLDSTPAQTQGAFEWNRQVLFLKGKTAASPNYFVIRDSMPGQGRLASYLYLNLLGTKNDVKNQGGRIAVDTEWPTKLDVLFAQPAAVTPTAHEQRLPLALHNSNIGERISAPGTISRNWVKTDGSPWQGKPLASQTNENHVILRIPGAPGAGYFWVLYPRRADEPVPQVSVLADGVMKITHPEGTDYVVLGASPIAYEGEGVVFRGQAGAVRLDPTSVVLVKAGGEGKVGYKGRSIAGGAAAEKRFALAQLTAGEEKVAAPAGTIDLPADAGDVQQVAPGVARETLGQGVIRYRLQGPESTIFKVGDIRLEGRSADVYIAGKKVRFVAGHGNYVKLSVGNRGVRGVGPFDLTFSDAGITGKVEGDTRSLVVTWPDGIVRPMFRMDGVRYCAGWADDHSIGKGQDSPQFSVAFGVTDGSHSIELTEWVYPELPPEPKRREIAF